MAVPDRAGTSLSRALTLAHTHRAALRSDFTERLGLTRTATGLVLRELETLSLLAYDGGYSSPSRRPDDRPSVPHRRDPSRCPDRCRSPGAGHLGADRGRATGRVARPGRRGPTARTCHSGVRARPDRRSVVGAARRLRLARRSASGWPCPRRSAPTARRSPRCHLAWPHAVPARSMLAGLLARAGLGDIPVHVGNDANLAALAESRHGAGRGAAQMLYVMTGQVGVGGGLVIDGRLQLGSAGYALEIGHTPVPQGDRPCRCGNRGCLEVEADPTALLAAAGVSTTEPTLARCADGDRPARRRPTGARGGRSRHPSGWPVDSPR